MNDTTLYKNKHIHKAQLDMYIVVSNIQCNCRLDNLGIADIIQTNCKKPQIISSKLAGKDMINVSSLPFPQYQNNGSDLSWINREAKQHCVRCRNKAVVNKSRAQALVMK